MIHALQYVNEDFLPMKIIRHACNSLLKPKFIANGLYGNYQKCIMCCTE